MVTCGRVSMAAYMHELRECVLVNPSTPWSYPGFTGFKCHGRMSDECSHEVITPQGRSSQLPPQQ